MSDCYRIAKGKNLVALALESVAEPATINNKATSNGVASGFVADKFYVHINRVRVNLEDNLNNNSASPTLLSGKEYINQQY